MIFGYDNSKCWLSFGGCHVVKVKLDQYFPLYLNCRYLLINYIKFNVEIQGWSLFGGRGGVTAAAPAPLQLPVVRRPPSTLVPSFGEKSESDFSC